MQLAGHLSSIKSQIFSCGSRMKDFGGSAMVVMSDATTSRSDMRQQADEALNYQERLAAGGRQISIETIQRSKMEIFLVLPARWTVERTITWLNRCRRHALAFLRWASTRLMVRKLCRS